MLITADQIIVHAIGDYLLQSDWMSNNKARLGTGTAVVAALSHAVVYSLPFLWFLHASPYAWFVIYLSHYFIDYFRLARYVVWLKNFLGPRGSNRPWSECKVTGYPADRPVWMAVWLMIIADNVLHILINGLALKYL